MPDSRLDAITSGLEARRTAFLDRELDRSFPDPVCKPENSRNSCVLGQLNLALALLMRDRGPAADDQANRLLVQAVENAQDGAWRENFHFMKAALFYRALRLFGASGFRRAGAVGPDARDRILDLFRDYATVQCPLSEPTRADVWRIWGSENHGAQRDGACWAAAGLLAADTARRDTRYADGSSAAAQASAWTNYLKAYIRARGRRGILVEYFSPTYAKYTLLSFYNYVDFADDPDLRRLARSFLDLWWANWAQEQVGGVHGGSKARSYLRSIAAGTPMGNAAFLYFGLGPAEQSYSPGEASAITSAYAPPAVVADIALDIDGRGRYEALTRAPGLPAAPQQDGWYALDPDGSAILRATSVAPGFVMGLAMVSKRPKQAWAAISSQNRWTGLVFSSGPEARIAIQPAIDRPTGSEYNPVWGVQHGATQIVQRLEAPYGSHVGAMQVWFGKPLKRTETNGWILVDDSAYVAVRPAWGGYDWDTAQPGMMRPIDSRAPIIVQAAAKTDYASLDAFRAAVLAAPLTVTDALVSFKGLNGAGTLSVFVNDTRLPEIDGRPIDLDPPFAIRSPFLHQKRDGTTVAIEKDGRRAVMSFD